MNSLSCANVSDINRLISVEKAKILALVIVTAAILYHGLIHFQYGADSCQWLLSSGRFQGYGVWQPYGCMMHKFSRGDTLNCMQYISYWGGRNHIVFVGDSRIRRLYYELVGFLSNEDEVQLTVHQDLNYIDGKNNLQVDFLWHPYVDENMSNVYQKWIETKVNARPKIVITGSATWTIKNYNASDEAFESFRYNLSQLVPKFEKLNSFTQIVWMLQDPVVESRLMSNRSTTITTTKNYFPRSVITNKQIDLYNKAVLEELMYSSVSIWSSSRLVAQGYVNDITDGLHIGKETLRWDIQILLNLYCNDQMNFDDGTCCTTTETATVMQLVMATIFIVSFVTMLIMMIWRYQKKSDSFENNDVSDDKQDTKETDENEVKVKVEVKVDDHWMWQISTSLTRLGLIMLYFFLCDRTTFFMKENKYYTHVNFFLPFSYLMILGFFFTEKTKQTTILHRDMTDEWKGWMQLVILVYHLTGANGVVPIYMQIRVMVSSYLFLSGFGHFHFFFTKADYSFHRFCTVLIRMNFLVILLCLVMNRPYQFYYFVPLVSFWFLVVYVFMAVWPHVTSSSIDSSAVHYFFMVLKLSALTAAITLMYSSEVFFEKIFLSTPLKALFVTTDDSLVDWRFRWSIDRYSTLYGLLFAFGMMIGRKFKLFNESNSESGLFSSRGLTWFISVTSVSCLTGYIIFTAVCRSKQECNEIHSYVAFVPILSYICLRNLPGWLRTKYSAFFAWFGQISLELFIGQYHIWLAADTHGLLVLLPGFPVMNVIVTSFIFVCVSHDIHCITNKLVPYLVPNDCKRLFRNIVCFTAALLPLAFSRGVVSI